MRKLWPLFLLVAQTVLAQNKELDSLKLQLSAAKTDENRLAVLKVLVNTAFETDINKAMEYARAGVELADKAGDKKAQPEFYEMKGRMHANMVQLDSAVLFFDKAMAGYKAIGNKKGQATTWFKIGWVHKKKQEIDKAMDADMTALKLMEELQDQKGIAGALERISDDLTRQGRLKEALDYAKKSIAICEKNGMKEELMYSFFNAGNVSITMGENAESLAFYDKAIAINREMNLGEMNLCDFSNGRGNALKRLGRYPEALNEYKKAQALSQKINYDNAANTVIANLGEVNLLMGNYSEALKYQLKTIEVMEATGDRANLVENYVHVSTIYEKLKDYPSALVYQKKARLLRDSTASKESDKAMSELLTKYETEKKQVTINSQQQQLSQQQRVQWLSMGVAALLAVLLFVGYRSYRARNKTNKLLAAKNAENELLLKEIHHRVKNNLEVVSSLLALQSAQIDDPNTKEAMQEGQNRVQSIGIVHQKLYQGENLGAIEMKDYFINLSENILDSFGADEKVQIECAMEKLNIDIDTAVPLGLIVNELLTNTLKYAFPDGRNGKVQIRLEKSKDGILQLQVSDNGVGKSGLTKGTGFGGQLVALLTKQLSGSMREEVNNGTNIFFEFKIEKAA
ncbi:MAG: histidine kinase dimerization/phosphoacceptor domain -containing protein [Chitinophagaceae bacterium]